jgi:hypothetical protein
MELPTLTADILYDLVEESAELAQKLWIGPK